MPDGRKLKSSPESHYEIMETFPDIQEEIGNIATMMEEREEEAQVQQGKASKSGSDGK
jgi:hypothetical protein